MREVREELGLEVGHIRFNKSKFYAGSNTLMINFSCVASSEDLSGRKTDEVDYVRWYSLDEARENVYHGSLAEEFLLHYLDHREQSE